MRERPRDPERKVQSWSIFTAFDLAIRGLSDGKLPKQMEVELRRDHHMHKRDAVRVVAHAKRFIRGVLKLTDEDWREGSLAFYLRLAQDTSLKPMERMAARARIDAIIGLEAPKKQAISSDSKSEQRLVIEYVGDDWKRKPRFELETQDDFNLDVT